MLTFHHVIAKRHPYDIAEFENMLYMLHHEDNECAKCLPGFPGEYSGIRG